MPGRVVAVMSASSTHGTVVNGKVDSAAAADAVPVKREDDMAVGGTPGVVNGGGLSNGSGALKTVPSRPASALGHNTANGASHSLQQLPPEIVNMIDGYESLGKLVGRVTQECFNDFSDLVDKLAAMPVDLPPLHLANGYVGPSDVNGPSSGAMSTINIQKKLMLLNFANSNREKLIKLMVICQWSAKVDQIKTLINLMLWANDQTTAYEETARQIGQLKIDLDPFKLPNPNITHALEVLSTGRAPWMPHLNLLPLPPLKPQAMLRTIKSINTALHIRLNIHEDLPLHLRDWRVSNGRATFTFPSEFEFDVTMADEDPSIQFYFVDLRFLFSPAPSLADGPLRDLIQYKADETLLASGIIGCADFLRNIVLTQKITILEKQARRLLKGAWSSGIRVDFVQRRLVIQYWVDAPFPKSWIEIGISSGESRTDVLPGEVSLPSIEARWKRYGSDVDGHALKLDLGTLSAERILRRALSSHIVDLLDTTMTKLRLAAGSNSILAMDLRRSEDEPEACWLELQLGTFSPEHLFSIEPYTGRLSLRPATLVSRNGEFDLNHGGPGSKNPMDYSAEKLEIYLCLELLVRYQERARDFGWESVPLAIPPHYLPSRLGCRCVRWMYFRPLGWEQEESCWLIALTLSLDGERWFVIEVPPTPPLDGEHITTAIPLCTLSASIDNRPLDQALLQEVDDVASRVVVDHVLMTQFDRRGVEFRILG